MDNEQADRSTDAHTYDILTGMREWRVQHPDATLTDIEQALDERWYRMRARMLEDLALQSSAAHGPAARPAEQPTCPDCGRPLVRRGQQPRTLKTHGGQDLTLPRSYGDCTACKTGHFPPR